MAQLKAGSTIGGDTALTTVVLNNVADDGSGTTSGGQLDTNTGKYGTQKIPTGGTNTRSCAVDGFYAVTSDPSSGQVILYKRSGSSTTWTIVDTSVTGSTAAKFGWEIEAHNGQVFVGSATGTTEGSVDVYDIDTINDQLVFVETLTANDPTKDNEFGYSIKVDGNWMIIGDRRGFNTSSQQTGIAHFYSKSGSNWVFHSTVEAGDGVALDDFGKDVSVSGVWAVVGAPHHNGGAGNDAGAIYLFKLVTGSWNFITKIDNPDGVSYSDLPEFGWSVDISGDYIAAGAPGYSTDGSTARDGKVYIFQRPTGNTWNLFQVPNNDPGSTWENYGWDVALTGKHLVVSRTAVVSAANVDVVLFYEQSQSTEEFYLTETEDGDTNSVDQFGYAVDVDATGLITVGRDSGEVWIYSTSGGNDPLYYATSGTTATFGDPPA